MFRFRLKLRSWMENRQTNSGDNNLKIIFTVAPSTALRDSKNLGWQFTSDNVKYEFLRNQLSLIASG